MPGRGGGPGGGSARAAGPRRRAPLRPARIGCAEIFVEISFLFSFSFLTKNTSDSSSTIPHPSLSLFFSFCPLICFLGSFIYFFYLFVLFFCVYFPSSLTATFFRPPSFYLCR